MNAISLAFEACQVSKSFPGVRALDAVSLKLHPGSIHALLGENGAGKSTLIKIVTGVYRPDQGELKRSGQLVHFSGPRDAIGAGIGVVHQERNLIPRFSVAENIFLERSSRHLFRPINFKALASEARPWLQRLGLDLDPALPVAGLTVAKMQMVEIAKALALSSRVLLLDEPTAALTPHESDTLFTALRKLRDEGVSMLFVSHKLEEVLQLCDTVTVLRDGRNVCDGEAMKTLGRQDLVRLMIGRSEQVITRPQRNIDDAEPALELNAVSSAIGHQDISLTVRRGEIVGLYGLVGAGRTELAKAIIGRFPIIKGTVKVNGQVVKIHSVSEAIHRYGIGYVSEDRKHEGLILTHSVLDNVGMTIWRQLINSMGMVTDKSVQKRVEPFIRKLAVKTPSLHQLLGLLSGGNQQKVSVAKWLAADVQILIIDEPTVGIDIQSKAYLHELIQELAGSGAAILLISSDMPEMISLADRIVVMNNYRVQGEIPNNRDSATMSIAIMSLIHDEASSKEYEPA